MATSPPDLHAVPTDPQRPGPTHNDPDRPAIDLRVPAGGSPPADPSAGQKVLDSFLELRNRLVRVETGFLEHLATIRGAKQGETPPPQAMAPRTETNFVAGATAVGADMRRSIGVIEDGLAELQRLF